MNKAYELGKRAHKKGGECLPQEDQIFWDYLTATDLPIVPTIKDYVQGYYDRKEMKDKKVQERRNQFRIIK